MKSPPLKIHERALITAIALSMVLWNLPVGEFTMLPFKFFATWLHESCHALVMLFTGAGIDGVEIFRDTSGITQSQRSAYVFAKPIIASAGYIGTSLVGAAMLLTLSCKRKTFICLVALSLALALSSYFLINNLFGVKVTLIGAAVLAAISFQPNANIRLYALAILAIQSCLHALLDIRVLFRKTMVINGEVTGASDAQRMADTTFGTPTLWAFVWITLSLVFSFCVT